MWCCTYPDSAPILNITAASTTVVVYLGAMRMDIAGFAATNVVLTLVWIGVALLILRRHRALVRLAQTPVAASILVGLMIGMMGSSVPAKMSAGCFNVQSHGRLVQPVIAMTW